MTNPIHYRSIQVEGLDIFYRESGPVEAPVILLLHGYPTSSHMFRNLIPLLNGRYRVIAPDLPGFGYSSAPDRSQFSYTFDRLASVMQSFTNQLGLTRFAIYVFDYGAPTGYRLAMWNPEKITAIISQNGNAYEEGLGEGWKPIREYWQDDTPAKRDALRAFVTLEGTNFQYYTGVADESLIAPEVITMDQYFLDRPGSDEIQLDLLRDYKNNVSLYPDFQLYFRKWQPNLLAVWGTRDPFFLPPGAEAYKRDIPGAVVKFYDTGHFALETHAQEIGADILRFMDSISH